jgi:hypothetical protein
MAEFNVRSDSVDVEQIMRQIRARIREKRGVDYTEAELQQLASVKLEKFLDPRGLRSDLVDQFRRHRIVSEAPPNYEFEDTTLYETHRGLVRWLRKVLNPILKLFFNPDKITSALHIQAKANAEFHRRFRQREEIDPLYYEVIHNLVLEITRLGIDVHNLKMRVESLSSRLDFDERRGRALEGVVEYRRSRGTPGAPGTPGPPEPARPGASGPPGTPGATAAGAPGTSGTPEAPGTPGLPAAPGGEGGLRSEGERRRRRRRRRRRPGQTLAETSGATARGETRAIDAPGATTAPEVDEGPDDAPDAGDEAPDQ